MPINGNCALHCLVSSVLDCIMIQHLVMDQNVTLYSDEASMANASNGESTLQVVTSQAIEEPKMGFAPQMQT